MQRQFERSPSHEGCSLTHAAPRAPCRQGCFSLIRSSSVVPSASPFNGLNGCRKPVGTSRCLTSKPVQPRFLSRPCGFSAACGRPAMPGLLDRALFWPLKLWRLRKLLRREQPDLVDRHDDAAGDQVGVGGRSWRRAWSSRSGTTPRPVHWLGVGVCCVVWRIPELICIWCKREALLSGCINAAWRAAPRFCPMRLFGRCPGCSPAHSRSLGCPPECRN